MAQAVVGGKVLYHPTSADRGHMNVADKPLEATVTLVLPGGLVNVVIKDTVGAEHPRTGLMVKALPEEGFCSPALGTASVAKSATRRR